MTFDGISVSWEAFVQSSFFYLYMNIFLSDLFKRKPIIKLGSMLFYQTYTRMSLIPLNDVNYKIISFYCVTKKTFIDNNAQVANNIYKKCVQNFSDILATRNRLIFLGKCYFITIIRTFICQKRVYSCPKFFIISDVFSIQFFKETFFSFRKRLTQ